jgi:hypothetical protein
MLRTDAMDDPLTAALAPPPDETPEDKTKRLKREIKAKVCARSRPRGSSLC